MRAPAPQAFQLRERLVVEVLEGDSLLETVDNLRVHRGASRAEWVARGRVDAVRWVGTDAPTRGTLEVIQLTGTVSDARRHLVLLGRAEDGQLRGGRIADARAVELELSVELLGREAAEVPDVIEPAAPAAPTTWAAVAAASARAEEPEAPAAPEVPLPQVGDHVEHTAFGDCTVEKVEEDEDFILVRSPTQRLLRLSLDVLRLELVGEDGGHRRYRARSSKGKA